MHTREAIMHKTTLLISMILLMFSCKIQTDSKTIDSPLKDSLTSEKSVVKINSQEKQDVKQIIKESLIMHSDSVLLLDTVSDFGKVTFSMISKEGYLKLMPYSNNSRIPIEKPTERIGNIDSCHLIRLGNGSVDSLCDYSDGEYYEKYEILSDWKEKNQLLIYYGNWEENLEFLYNKTDGAIYNLGVDYKLSTDLNWILYFSNMVEQPLYNNGFGLAYLDSLVIQPLFDLDEIDFAVKNVDWINDSISILNIATFDFEIEGGYVDDFYYVMKVGK